MLLRLRRRLALLVWVRWQSRAKGGGDRSRHIRLGIVARANSARIANKGNIASDWQALPSEAPPQSQFGAVVADVGQFLGEVGQHRHLLGHCADVRGGEFAPATRWRLACRSAACVRSSRGGRSGRNAIHLQVVWGSGCLVRPRRGSPTLGRELVCRPEPLSRGVGATLRRAAIVPERGPRNSSGDGWSSCIPARAGGTISMARCILPLVRAVTGYSTLRETSGGRGAGP